MRFSCSALIAAILLLISGTTWASGDDWEVLRKAALAGQHQPLSGVYLHQSGRGEQETFRIYRMEQPGLQVLERRESLDGLPREVLRKGSELISSAPDKPSLLAARAGATRLFPAVLPENVSMLAASYTVDERQKDRVAGMDCRWYRLRSLDKLRYSQSFCIELNDSLPLKMVVATPSGTVVEQFTFTSVELKAPRNKAVFKPRYPLSYSQHAAVQPAAALPAVKPPQRISVTGLPTGFRLLKAVERTVPDQKQPMHHLIYGDGLVMFSLFVEPKNKLQKPQAVQVQGTLTMASMGYGNYWLTIVGDMPGQSLVGMLKATKVVVQ